jgi:Nucleoside-diphosphate-sugar pyrophosphorylase involved in lipopolysaccharide biosynthesis/translation initiation factor 2B, gamma/epsilon subunits (eIF-2Bgamma/eIF-2Bepsilon)
VGALIMNAVPRPDATPRPAVPTYIVQAGGQGSRMEHYTWNKPKCLVPIDGKPLLYHLFDAAPDAHFIVIGDYLFDVLKAYIETFPPPARTTLVHSTGKGTCAGISQALSLVEDDTAPVGLVWCDLLFGRLPEHHAVSRPVIGISTHFPCRWSLHPRRGLIEDLSFDRGVAGYFAFPNASFLHSVPAEGEFVRWLSTVLGDFETVTLDHCNEVGNSAVAIRHWEQRGFARFFNDVQMLPDRVEKRARVSSLSYKLDEEAAWYEEVARRGYKNVPELIGRSPLTLSRIDGAHPDEINLKPKEKHELLGRVFQSLKDLHDLGSAPAVPQDCEDTYVAKTVMRVAKILSLVPGHDQPFVTINGKRCRNPFADGNGLKELIGDIACEKFTFFHGDPTFANMLVGKSGEIFLIDPRVVFGRSRFFGDPDYDWAKLYYSAIGDYDAFNKRRFRLVVWDSTISLDIDSAGFSFTKSLFRDVLGEKRFHKVELLHALIWLSLAGYVDDDVDSMIAAFYNGLYWLEEWAQ